MNILFPVALLAASTSFELSGPCDYVENVDLDPLPSVWGPFFVQIDFTWNRKHFANEVHSSQSALVSLVWKPTFDNTENLLKDTRCLRVGRETFETNNNFVKPGVGITEDTDLRMQD